MDYHFFITFCVQMVEDSVTSMQADAQALNDKDRDVNQDVTHETSTVKKEVGVILLSISLSLSKCNRFNPLTQYWL